MAKLVIGALLIIICVISFFWVCVEMFAESKDIESLKLAFTTFTLSLLGSIGTFSDD